MLFAPILCQTLLYVLIIFCNFCWIYAVSQDVIQDLPLKLRPADVDPLLMMSPTGKKSNSCCYFNMCGIFRQWLSMTVSEITHYILSCTIFTHHHFICAINPGDQSPTVQSVTYFRWENYPCTVILLSFIFLFNNLNWFICLIWNEKFHHMLYCVWFLHATFVKHLLLFFPREHDFMFLVHIKQLFQKSQPVHIMCKQHYKPAVCFLFGGDLLWP